MYLCCLIFTFIWFFVNVVLSCSLGEYYDDGCNVCGPGYCCLDGFNRTNCTGGCFCNKWYEPETDCCPNECLEAFYCPPGSGGMLLCESGYYCPISGLVEPLLCPCGKFCRDRTINATENCPAGYFCPNGTGPHNLELFRCKERYYCPQGTSYFDEYPCITGFYCPDNTSDYRVNVCPTGYYCPPQTGSSDLDSLVCPEKYYCPLGSPAPILCKDGFVCPTGTGNMKKVCPKGYYCVEGEVKKCPPAASCPIGSSEPIYSWIGFFDSPGPPIILTVFLLSFCCYLGYMYCYSICCCCCLVCVKQCSRLRFYKKYEKDIELIELKKGKGQSDDDRDYDDDDDGHIRLKKRFYQIKWEDFELKKHIGEGGFARVYLGRWKGQDIAVKLFETTYMKDNSVIVSFENEVNILSKISHPNIIRLYGACLAIPKIAMLTELCVNGSIKSIFLDSENEIRETLRNEKNRLIYEIAIAMKYLDDTYIIHLDLNPANVLISEELTCKLIDFGVSVSLLGSEDEQLLKQSKKKKSKKNEQIQPEHNTTSVTVQQDDIKGSRGFMAPEYTLSGKIHSKADVFSFGIVCYCILFEIFDPYMYVLFEDRDVDLDMKVAKDPEFRPLIKEGDAVKVQEWMINLMKKCWEHDVESRCTFEEVVTVLKENM